MSTIHHLRIQREIAARDRAAATKPTTATDWTAELQARCAAGGIGRMLRIAYLQHHSITRGEGAFDSTCASSGTGESIDVDCTTGGYCGDTPALPTAVRRVARAGRLVRRQRDRREAVLAAARLKASAARRVTLMQREAVILAPIVTVTEDVSRMALKQRQDAAGVRRVVAVYSHSRRPASRPLDAMSAIEEHILQRDATHAAIASLMASEPQRDGRGTVDRTAVEAVNGTEVRASERWHSTPRVAMMTTVETRNGVACVAPIDWGCYRIGADGTRTPLVSTTTAAKRKRKATGNGAQAKRVALLAMATTEGHVEAATL